MMARKISFVGLSQKWDNFRTASIEQTGKRKAFVGKISKNYEFPAKFLGRFVLEAQWLGFTIGNCSKILPWQLWCSEKECAPVTPLYKRDTIVIQKRKVDEKLTTVIQTKNQRFLRF
jgi:hypothetical protein